jgi:hypothetical protein
VAGEDNKYLDRVRVDSRTELVIETDIAKWLEMTLQRVYVLAAGTRLPEGLEAG